MSHIFHQFLINFLIQNFTLNKLTPWPQLWVYIFRPTYFDFFEFMSITHWSNKRQIFFCQFSSGKFLKKFIRIDLPTTFLNIFGSIKIFPVILFNVNTEFFSKITLYVPNNNVLYNCESWGRVRGDFEEKILSIYSISNNVRQYFFQIRKPGHFSIFIRKYPLFSF